MKNIHRADIEYNPNVTTLFIAIKFMGKIKSWIEARNQNY